jgi:hypothetical protein
VRAASAKIGCYLSAELASSKVIIEDRDVDIVEELGGLFDGGGWDALVAMLAEDGSAEVQVGWFIVQQEHAHVRRTGIWDFVGVGRFDHR